MRNNSAFGRPRAQDRLLAWWHTQNRSARANRVLSGVVAVVVLGLMVAATRSDGARPDTGLSTLAQPGSEPTVLFVPSTTSAPTTLAPTTSSSTSTTASAPTTTRTTVAARPAPVSTPAPATAQTTSPAPPPPLPSADPPPAPAPPAPTTTATAPPTTSLTPLPTSTTTVVRAVALGTPIGPVGSP